MRRHVNYVFSLMLCASILIQSCMKDPAPSSSNPTQAVTAFVPVEGAKYLAGKDVYMTHCFFCHGEKADGKGPLAGSLGSPTPRDFTQPSVALQSPDSLKHVILQGGEALGLSANMPAWNGTLNDEEVIAVVGFIQAVSLNRGIPPERTHLPQAADTDLKDSDITY